VSGHDFSRAERATKIWRALAPAVLVIQLFTILQRLNPESNWCVSRHAARRLLPFEPETEGGFARGPNACLSLNLICRELPSLGAHWQIGREGRKSQLGIYRLRENFVCYRINSCFVTGHDFSRAVTAIKSTWALAPAGCFSRTSPVILVFPQPDCPLTNSIYEEGRGFILQTNGIYGGNRGIYPPDKGEQRIGPSGPEQYVRDGPGPYPPNTPVPLNTPAAMC
jgi:hypothetical protein